MVPVVPATALLTKFTGTLISSPPPMSCMSMVMVSPPGLAICAWMRGRSDWGSDSETLIGWISLMVTSGLAVEIPLVVLLVGLEEVELTILPGWIRIGPVLPFTGERMVVYSRFSRADSTLALASR